MRIRFGSPRAPGQYKERAVPGRVNTHHLVSPESHPRSASSPLRRGAPGLAGQSGASDDLGQFVPEIPEYGTTFPTP